MEKHQPAELPLSRDSTPREQARDQRRGRGVFLSFLAFIFFSSLLHPATRCHHPVQKLYDHCRPHSIEQRVTTILTTTPLIDGHNDLAFLLRALYNNQIYTKNFTESFEKGGLAGHVDLPRLRHGLNGGAFWSVFTPCPNNGTDFSDENYAASVQFTLHQIDVMTRLQQAYPRAFSGTPLSSKEARSAFHNGKLISPLGIEGLHQIGNSASNLRHFHALGVRYATLTHNCGNIYADAALQENPFRVAPPRWGGVSEQGKLLISEMNRIGMLVDLAHVSADTMRHVLGAGKDEWTGSKAPVMFSHSSARTICPHPRNVPDDVLELVKKTNSIVMVNFAPDFVSCTASDREDGLPDFFPGNSTLSHVVDHITYIGNLIGYDHVGLGSDFDGIESIPKGLEDVSKYPDLFAELLRRGVSDEDASKIAGKNILRVWNDAEEVAMKMQADGEPVLEDKLPKLWSGSFDT